jgi:putative aldouronate transport system permease protein
MYGAQIAFRDFQASKGFFRSDWVGLENFEKFFNSPYFVRIIRNTLEISLYTLIAGFPLPIILALSLNCSLSKRFKKTVQMIAYAPYFISTVVMVGMIMQFLSPKIGFVNRGIGFLGISPIHFLGDAGWFSSVYVWSGIWQHLGWSSIIYLAALSTVDPNLHEAAIVDGASRFKRVIHIDIPRILPTIIVLLIIQSGQIMNVGFEKVILLQNSLNLSRSEIITTYVYKVGLVSSIPNYSYGAAIGLFNSVINVILILSVNKLSKTITNQSLW